MNPFLQSRDAGYDDAEILAHLETHPEYKDKLAKSREAGYSDEEIADFLSKQQAPEQSVSQNLGPQLAALEGIDEAQPQTLNMSFKPKEFGEQLNNKFKEIMEPARRQLSSLTLGGSELIPGFDVTPEEREAESFADKAIDLAFSLYPAELGIKLIANPITKKTLQWAAKSPYGAKTLAAVGRLTGLGLTGAALSGTEEAVHGKLPDPDQMIEHGLVWMAIDAALSATGKTYAFGKSLYRTATLTKQPVADIAVDIAKKVRESGVNISNATAVEDAAQKAIESLPQPTTGKLDRMRVKNTPFTIQQTEAIAPESLNFEASASEVAEETIAAEAQTLADDIENFHPSAGTEEQAGLAIKEAIDTEAATLAQQEKSLYDRVETAAKSLPSNPIDVRREARTALENIDKLKTQPTGFAAVKTRLFEVLEDLGRGFQSTTTLLELGRRLNAIINYESIEPHVTRILKPIVKSVKSQIRKALSKDAEALALFNEAETLHGTNIERFRNKNTLRTRGETIHERIASDLDSPSLLRNTLEAAPPAQRKLVERAWLDRVSEASPQRAKKMVRESGRHVSQEARQLGQRISESKAPRNAVKDVNNTITNELIKTAETGEVPQHAVKLWRTPRGQNAVNNALRGVKNAGEVRKYLNQQLVVDWLSGIVNKTTGQIDRKLLRQFLNDPAARKSLELAYGPDGVKYFKSLDAGLSHLEQGVRLFEQSNKALPAKRVQRSATLERRAIHNKEQVAKLEEAQANQAEQAQLQAEKERRPVSTKIEALFGNLGIIPTNVLALAGFFKFPTATTAAASIWALIRIAESPAVRTAFIAASKAKPSAARSVALLNLMDKIDVEDDQPIRLRAEKPRPKRTRLQL